MSIVKEKDVSIALEYLAEDPHPIALARRDLAEAENEFEKSAATSYLKQTGTVAEREAAVTIDPRVEVAKAKIVQASFHVENHKARLRGSEMLISVWQSEGANARAADRVK